MAIFNANKRNKRAHRGRSSKNSSSDENITKTLSVHGLSHEAQGVAKDGERVVFVSGALPQETIEARIVEQKRRYSLAETQTIIQSSEYRVSPLCVHYDHCGGCQLQHLAGAQQVIYKQSNLQHELQSKLKLDKVPWHTPIVADDYAYRRRARIGIRYRHKLGEVIVGFRERNNTHLVDIEQCPVLVEQLQELIPSMKRVLQQLQKVDVITQAQLLAGDESRVVNFRVIKALPQDDIDALIAWATAESLQLDLQLDEGLKTLYKPNDKGLWFDVAGRRIEFTSNSFVQANARVNEQMVQTALSWLNVTPAEVVLDLFAGLGNFTLPLADHAAKVIAVELDKTMVSDLQANAERNGLVNVDVALGNLDDMAAVERMPKTDVIVLDPPRAGAANIMPWIAKQKSRVLYVACEPSSLVRDAAVLIDSGYKLEKVVVLDMFPQTKHIETMALFIPPS